MLVLTTKPPDNNAYQCNINTNTEILTNTIMFISITKLADNNALTITISLIGEHPRER